jgi:insulysin
MMYLSFVRSSFAQFFISPLFAASSTDRELEAVNSEYEGNLFKDSWRISQLEKSTSDPEHPYSHFSIGNTESLRTVPKQRGIDIRQVLLDFHKNHYSANRMSLAVLGNRKALRQNLFAQYLKTNILESLDELQSLVIKSFRDVKNKNLEKLKYPSDPYGEHKRKVNEYMIVH